MPRRNSFASSCGAANESGPAADLGAKRPCRCSKDSRARRFPHPLRSALLTSQSASVPAPRSSQVRLKFAVPRPVDRGPNRRRSCRVRRAGAWRGFCPRRKAGRLPRSNPHRASNPRATSESQMCRCRAFVRPTSNRVWSGKKFGQYAEWRRRAMPGFLRNAA